MSFAEQSHNLPSCKYTYRKCIFYDTLYSCTWASSSHHSWQGYWASSSMANLVRLTLQVCTSEWNKQKTEAFNTGSYVVFGGKFTSCCETTCHLVHLLWNLLTQLALFVLHVVHHHVSLTSLNSAMTMVFGQASFIYNRKEKVIQRKFETSGLKNFKINV